jgi:AraC-like DNA-binding protein
MQKSHATISSWVSAVGRTLARRYLIDPKPVFQALGIAGERLNDPEYRVPVVLMTQLWRQAVQLTGDEAFGLEVAQQVSPLTFRGVGVDAMASRSLQEAVFRIIQNANTVSDVAKLSIQGHQDALWLRFDLRDDSPDVAHESLEAFMAAIVHLGRTYLQMQLPLRAVYLKRPVPADVKRYEDFFQAPVHFGAECDALASRMETMMMLMPAAAGNDPGAAMLARWRERIQNPDIRWQVMEIIDRLLPEEPRQDKVAQALNMSVRTLQRKLDAEGSSFQALLDTTRKSLAERWLRENHMSIQQIADALGFANPSALTRAFKRWNGQSPEQFRAGHRD